MREVTVSEARRSWSKLVALANMREEITITRRGKTMARLVPPARTEAQIAQAPEAVRAIREMRKQVKPDPDGLTVRNYVEMGRRYCC